MPSAGRDLRPVAVAIAAALAPWTWFLLRDLRPEFDLLAIALPPIAALAFAGMVALALRRRSVPIAVGGVSTLLVAMVAVVAPWRPVGGPEPVGGVVVVASNSGYASDVEASAQALLAAEPDVLVVSELRGRLDDRLWDALPDRLVAGGRLDQSSRRDISLALYSRWPMAALPTPAEFPGVRARVDHPDHPFVVLAVHVPKPALRTDGYATTFGHHRSLVEQVRDLAVDGELPVVVAGDLNASDRAGDYRLLDRSLRDAVRSSWAGPTSRKRSFGWWALLLRIDHVLVSETWCAADGGRITVPTADHVAVTARVGPCP